MTWSYGAEHELGDWDRATDLAQFRMGVDERDVTVMNSNGIAADPRGRMHRYGGEINTCPTNCMGGQVEQLVLIKENLPPRVDVNHRSNLHIHIRVPELGRDLKLLKRVADFGQRVLPAVLPVIEPLPRPRDYHPLAGSPRAEEEYQGALRRWRRRRVSHQTILTAERHARRMEAKTVQEFHDLTAPQTKDGRPQHHLQPREAVNLRQLMQTDTVEFRHFPGTLDPKLLTGALMWCHQYMTAALQEREEAILDLADRTGEIIPWPEYEHYKEVRYRATCHDGTLSDQEIARNIQRILAGDFDEHPV
jgi:hypothetical protein